MANKLKITKNSGTTDAAVSPIQVGGSYIGGTGGITSQTGQQILPQVYITGGSSLAGSIVRQKAAHRFLVTDGTLTGQCYTVNSPNLSAGQMNILVNLWSMTANVAAASSPTGATSTYVTWTATPTGPITMPRQGDYIIGFSGTAAVAQILSVNSASNVTIAVSGNVSSQTGVSITESTYASRITNKTIRDFNGNKFFYHLAAPTATYVQVQSA
jgi:hypothetical protein